MLNSCASSHFFYHSHLSRLPPNPVAGCVHKKLHLFMFASASQFGLFSIREVDGAMSGSERARVSSQISNNFFWHTHILNTDGETQRDCLILDSRAFNSPHTLPALTSLHIKTSLMNVLLGQLLRKWRFSSPALPPSLPLFCPAPFSLRLHLPLMLLFGLVCLIRWGGANPRLVPLLCSEPLCSVFLDSPRFSL